MDGFYITIKNGLIKKEHVKAMKGDSVWLFMWFLDKMTIIDHEKGEGKVLGGKPIKFEEVNEDLGMSRRTYNRWVNMLRKGGYIETKRTPYGLIVTVFKAFKVFNQRSAKKSTSKKERSAKNDISNVPKTAHLGNERGTSNKTRQKTGHKDNTNTATEPQIVSSYHKEVVEIIDLFFKNINPAAKNFYNNKTQRKAAGEIVVDYGFERVKKIIEVVLPKTNGLDFFPRIYTPLQLRDKWVALADAVKNNNERSKKNTRGVMSTI